jgi:hypothetical protein
MSYSAIITLLTMLHDNANLSVVTKSTQCLFDNDLNDRLTKSILIN